jgi:hypothetical protein
MRQLLALFLLTAVTACAHAPSTISGKWVRDDVNPAAAGSTCVNTSTTSFEFAVSTVTMVIQGKTRTSDVKYNTESDGKSIDVTEYSASGRPLSTVILTPNDDDTAMFMSFANDPTSKCYFKRA